MLKIENLEVAVDNTKILHGLNLEIKEGEIHAIMGPNGSGKSTLSKAIAGHPGYEILDGKISYNGKLINNLDVEERSHLGIFLGFQIPPELPSINNADFLREIYNAKRKKLKENEIDPLSFLEFIYKKLELLNIKKEFLNRNVNEGFSGGEKKKNEILQMAILNSSLGILDEIDSGLDIDALKILSEAINKIFVSSKSLLLITHYTRLLKYVKPDYVHVMHQGKIIHTGSKELANELELKGYEWLT